MSGEKDFVIENGVLKKYIGKGGDVVIPDGVTEIGWHAFEDCSGLTSIAIPNGVTEIGVFAFYGCTTLTSVTIPDSVTKIGSDAFAGCTGLTRVDITDLSAWYKIAFIDTPLRYAHNLYLNGEPITDLVIPEGVTEIGYSTFTGCTGLTSVTIPASIVKIGFQAFAGCTGVEEYRVAADNPKYAGDGPLLLGTASKTIIAAGKVEGHITLPDCVNKIGENAFEGCAELTGVAIPEGYVSIRERAFFGCVKLSDAALPKTVTRVSERAFAGCGKLPFIVWVHPDTKELKDPGVAVLLDAVSPSKLPSEYQESSVLAFAEQYVSGAEMPESRRKNYLDYIRRTRKRWLETAMDHPALLQVLLAEKIIDVKLFPEVLSMAQERNKTEIAAMLLEYQNDASFQTEKKKEETREEARVQRFFETGKLTVSELKKIWDCKKLEDGSLEIRQYKGDETEVVFPDVIGKTPVTKIGWDAFSGCKKLVSITIPGSVTKIGVGAFEDCTGLTSISILDGVTEIGGRAFSGCTELTSVTIPKSVREIGGAAFGDCEKLTSVTIPKSVRKIGDNAFDDTPWQKSLGDFVVVNGILFKYQGPDGDVVIPDGVTKIGVSAFFGCTGLTSITIPAGVTKIESGAFSRCTNLASVTIPAGVTKIGSEAFSRCTNLASITIPKGVREIGGYAFSGCTGLTSVTIPDSVTKIGDYAFADCTALTSITIPNSVTKIGWMPFWDCPNLTIHTPAGSAAEKYAKKYGIPFVAE